MPDDPIAVGDWAWGAMKIHEIAAPLRPRNLRCQMTQMTKLKYQMNSNDQMPAARSFKSFFAG